MENVLISGGNGLVGKALSRKLTEKGYLVTILSRRPDPEARYKIFFWDPDKNIIDEEAVAEADYIIHLAGENLGEKRWTAERKQQIIDSRVKSGELLFTKTIETGKKVKTFISASAIGYYGSVTSDRIITESDPGATDFTGKVCVLWEKIALKFEERGIRSVRLRTGIVLAPKGGALDKMALVSKLGIGSPIGTGNQFLPWIHIDDLCGIYVKALEDPLMNGAYNAIAPEHRTNSEFTRILASVLHRPYFAPRIPEFLLKLLYGEMALMLLRGSRVSCEKIVKAGFNFGFPELRDALTDVLKKR